MSDDFNTVDIFDFGEELGWSFALLCAAVHNIGDDWVVGLNFNEKAPEKSSWLIFPYDHEQMDILEEVDFDKYQKHPDRVVLEMRDGIMFAKPTNATKSQWMAVQLRNQPELAGRII